MKRKAETVEADSDGAAKRQATKSVQDSFGPGIFDETTIKTHTDEYARSTPYKHAVVSGLITDDLIRSVRSEIVANIHFTPKETDIYKIHQSGDLANLDGLPASALQKLPSLLKLRDALYSKDFRQWVSTVSGAGLLSGTKTDMAVNVYVPGCHLLCHDDVIGSRRVSYILYLTDPDRPWKAEWGGALRLYATDEVTDADGKTFKFPQADWCKVIPPAWNQLSFFAVQPGESFHDVEEVYSRTPGGGEEDDGGRTRMAISGWFHIPQPGEEGFEPGLEERLAEKSSLQQLQGKADEFDAPQQNWISPGARSDAQSGEESADELTEEELQFLIQFMTPTYLTPDTVEELNEIFTEESVLQLTNFLSDKFSASLKASLDAGDEQKKKTLSSWTTSRPPHKHRYQYLQSAIEEGNQAPSPSSPLTQVLNELLPSLAFRKWLSLVTGLTLQRCAILARRFRRGLDYQLAQGYEGENPQLEYTLCVTPTTGWGAGAGADDEATPATNGKANGKAKIVEGAAEDDEDGANVGGYELYMAGDDDDDEDDEEDENPGEGGREGGGGVPNPSAHVPSHTGAGQRRPATKKSTKADPAVYRAAAGDGDGEDDGILFSNPAGWNTMSIVLRDRGTLKFVKYVSQSAPGDRFDFTGCVEVEPDEEEEEE